MAAHIYTSKEVDKIMASGVIAYDTHMMLRKYLKPGISTLELDTIAREYIVKRGGKPSFLGYQGFPATLCTSLNDAVVHGIPKKEDVLEDGDILSIDLGVIYNEYYSDTAWTWPIGSVSGEKKKLITVTQQCLFMGIQNALAGNRTGAIGAVVQKHAESNGYGVVRSLVGHGVGRSVHEEPQVPNFGKKKDGVKIRAGMVLAIEPMINQGSFKVVTDNDDWTVRTDDGKMSAHFEHTVAITADGPKICTLPKGAEINVFELLAS